ncbi:putative 3-hydroxybutyryl-CoA dehydrogenase [Actinosynnema sp. ALI-1.44]
MTRFAIVGAGNRGLGIAVVLARGGYRVTLTDPAAERVSAVDQAMARTLSRQGVTGPNGARVASRIGVAPTIAEAVVNADIVVETASDRLARKRDLLAAIDAAADGTARLWTETDVLPVTDLAAGLRAPQHLVGFRWWNRGSPDQLVELVPGPATDPQAVDDAFYRLGELGVRGVRLRRDTPGFVGNRLRFALLREALHLVESGVCDARTVDAVTRTALAPLLADGPLSHADSTGLADIRRKLEALAPRLSAAPGSSRLLDTLLDDADPTSAPRLHTTAGGG